MSQKNDNTNESIADKLARLNELVAWFENDTFELEKAIDQFNEAQKLADEIERELHEFKNKITVLKKDFSQE